MSDENPKGGPEKQAPKFNIKLDDQIAKGTYANVAVLHNSDAEFVFDFVFMEPQRGRGQVVSRVISNPKTAKKLMLGLTEIIAAYEKRFGEIVLPQAPAPKGTYH